MTLGSRQQAMDIALCPYIRRAWYSILNPGEEIYPRVIFDYELLFVKGGSAKIVIENKEYDAKPGDLFIFRPKQRHAIYVSDDGEFVQPHIHFDLQYYSNREVVPVSYDDLPNMDSTQVTYFREDVLDKFISPFPSYIHPHNGIYIEQILFDIINAVEHPKIFNDIHILKLFFKLWEQILLEATYASQKVTRGDDSASAMKDFIERNDSRQITLDEMAKVMHFSKSYIDRVFKKEYGISPIKYHTLMRVQKAKRMIYFTNMSLSEISEALGFESLQDFSRVFKNTDGFAPSYYRKGKSIGDREI